MVDVLVVTETWFNNQVVNTQVKLDGFNEPLRCDRADGYGGVAIYTNLRLGTTRYPECELPNYDSVCVKVQEDKVNVFVLGLYRPPKLSRPEFDVFKNQLQQSIENIQRIANEKDLIVLTGDINVHCNAWFPARASTRFGDEIEELTSSLGITQMVNHATYFRNNNYASLLDVVMCNKPNMFISSECKAALTERNHHHPVIATFALPKPKRDVYTREIFMFDKLTHLDILAMNNQLAFNYEWGSRIFNDGECIDVQVDYLTKAINEIMRSSIPSKKLSANAGDPDWLIMNPGIKKMLKKRNTLCKRYHNSLELNSPRTSVLYEKYKSYRKHLDSVIKNARTKDTQCKINKLADPLLPPKKMHGVLKNALKNVDKSDSSIPAIKHPTSNQIVSSPLDKANIFATQFSDASNVDYTDKVLPPREEPQTERELNRIEVTANELTNIIINLESCKTAGPDGIGNKVIKLFLPTLINILPGIFQNSLNQGIFPKYWKSGAVTPIFKNKGSRSDPNNYRPITLTCCLGKLLEKIVNNRMTEFFDQHHLLSDSQSGFRKNDSTTCQLLSISHMLLQNCAKGKSTQAIFLDISKAFDRVWHKQLVNKLRKMGINGVLLKWLESYLQGREIYVVLDGKKTKLYKINAGVPQGAILAPLLFLCFINDLPGCISSLSKLYADDTSIFSIIGSEGSTLQQDLRKIEIWATKNDIIFNATKTKSVIFSKNGTTADIPLYFFGNQIEVLSMHKHLGILLDSKLTWAPEISRRCTAMMKLVNMLRPLKGTLLTKSLNRIYLSYIQPHADYAAAIFGQLDDSQCKRLENVQYQAGLVVSGLPKTTGYNTVLDELGWHTLEDRRTRLRLCLLYQIINGLSPNYLNRILLESKQVIQRVRHNTRTPLAEFNIRQWGRQAYMMRSYFPVTILQWELTSNDMKNTNSTNAYKSKLKRNYSVPSISKTICKSRKEEILIAKCRQHSLPTKSWLFKRGLATSKYCLCGQVETSLHFLLLCPIYRSQREQLLASTKPIMDAVFTSNSVQLDTFKLLTRGSNLLRQEQNQVLQECTISFIMNTSRFK